MFRTCAYVVSALLMAAPGLAADLNVAPTDGGWTVTFDGAAVCTYHFDARLPKPWIDPLYTPAGHNVVVTSPPDHVHHRGLMFAWGSIRPEGEPPGYHLVFWGEQGAPHDLGRIGPDPDRQPEVSAGADGVHIVTHNLWLRNSDDLLVLRERREVWVHPPTSDRGYLLTWTTEQTPEMNLLIGPTPGRDVSYYGLGIRCAPDMDGGLLVNSNGREDVAGCHGDRADWCAYQGPTEPIRGFALLDHPDNPRYPTGWFAMNSFGYLTASLPAYEEYALRAGQTLKLTYGALVFDGPADTAWIDQQYDAWLKLTGARNARKPPSRPETMAVQRKGKTVFAPEISPAVAKPYYHPLATPSGHAVTDPRHPQRHHHALWFTWGKIALAAGGGVDFWAEGGDPNSTGRVMTDTMEVRRDGERTQYESVHLWRRVGGREPFIRELREVRVEPAGDRAMLTTFVTRQTALEDLTLLSQSNEAVSYYGLALQMPPDMFNGLVVNANGSVGREGVEGEPATWCAYATDVRPARGVALFGHPQNPRHPNTYFTLPTGFLSTSLVAREDYPMKAGETLTLAYGVLVFDGDFDRKRVETEYRRWRKRPLPGAGETGDDGSHLRQGGAQWAKSASASTWSSCGART